MEEDSKLNESIQSILLNIKQIQNSILQLRQKLEFQEALDWPSMLESYAVISNQVSSLLTYAQSERCFQLQNICLLPVHLSPIADSNLQMLTEGRLATFDHETAPNYLRTKLEPDAEAFDNERTASFTSGSAKSADTLQKHISTLNKACTTVLDLLGGSAAADGDDSTGDTKPPESCSMQDSYRLIRAVEQGHELIQQRTAPPTQQMQQPPGMPRGPASGGGHMMGSTYIGSPPTSNYQAGGTMQMQASGHANVNRFPAPQTAHSAGVRPSSASYQR